MQSPSGQSETRRPSQARIEMFGATGSSILLPGFSKEHFQNVHFIRWTFLATQILDYYNTTQRPSFTNLYKNRCNFFPSNGSLVLRNVTMEDQGQYRVQINLNYSRSREIKLNVVEPLSQPLIMSDLTDVDTTVELICQVSVGKASSIQWRKDDEVITNGPQYQLVQNKLIISKAKKSDCGNYTCTVKNPVSEMNNLYFLSIHGLPPLHRYTVGLSIAALISAAATLFGIIILCLHENSQAIGLELHKKMLQFLQIATMLSLIILFAAFVCWVCGEGPSGIAVFMLVLLSVLLILTILAAYVMKASVSQWLSAILSIKLCSVMMDAVTPLGVIIVICASGILLEEVMKQAGKGCEPVANLQSSIIPAVAVPLIILLLLFGVYIMHYKKPKQQTTGTPPACQDEEDSSQPQCAEEVPLQATSEGNCSNSRSSANGQEPDQT
ncbi:uncharacterized protein [Heptranchias perlo]|uniref:uncharacterized protein isoform X2 n=1 Tax=Heptranchias perlo TaxID=212740 RepID=UPI00355AA31F